ncbi:RRM_1 domain-containing protein [Cephalotus follicularis]|uniref:RRM_1 domain-containing protein n=1 Tax=Cephalotus follicularis TaxID=3775 RepID=A0A1Q3B764_CEPFO|nr:RRM_1 domain-containing protein [Cephalotus follicularis]
MSPSTLSIAASHAAASSFTPIYTKLSDLFSCQCLNPLPTHSTSKPIYPKPIKLKTHNSISLSLPLPHFRPFSATFDSFQLENNSETDDPETEDDEKHQEEEEVQEVTESGIGYSEVGRLYVGNLPFAMTSSQLAGVFGEAGRVVNVEIVYDRVTDRSRGFGFVTMGSVEEAQKAIILFDGSQVGGRTVKVNFPEVPRGGEREVMGPRIRSSYQGFVDSPHKIYAGNLGWGLTSQGLRDAFADQPGLLSARIIYDRNSGRSRGFGFITFETAENVEYSLNAMNGVEVEGRPLRLNLASERPPIAPPLVSNSENNFDSSELLSSIITCE